MGIHLGKINSRPFYLLKSNISLDPKLGTTTKYMCINLLTLFHQGGNMPIERFSFAELEKRIAAIELDIDKIEFISSEIVRCRNAIQDVKCEAKKIEPGEVKLFVKIASQDKSFVELINIDQKTKQIATKMIAKICKKNLCAEYYDFIERAESLLLHYKTKLEMRATWNECARNENYTKNEDFQIERIIWLVGKDMLLRLFLCLLRDEYITEYSKEEILVHFADEKHRPFCQSKGYSIKIRWRKSDDSFAILISEMAKRGMIDNKNIDRIFEKHFVNRDGNSFKDLAQKRYNTKNFTKTGNNISKILDSLV